MGTRLSCLRIQVPLLNHARATDKQPKDTTAHYTATLREALTATIPHTTLHQIHHSQSSLESLSTLQNIHTHTPQPCRKHSYAPSLRRIPFRSPRPPSFNPTNKHTTPLTQTLPAHHPHPPLRNNIPRLHLRPQHRNALRPLPDLNLEQHHNQHHPASPHNRNLARPQHPRSPARREHERGRAVQVRGEQYYHSAFE
jgi:hypothetical protein